MKRVLFLIIALFLLTGCSSAVLTGFDKTAEQARQGTAASFSGCSEITSNGKYSLWLDAEHSSFEIKSVSGTVWRSLPQNFDDAEWVNAMLKSNVASLITVTALDASLSNQVLASYDECVRNGTISYETIPNGLRFIFTYQKQGITVPLDIELTEYGFAARISPGSILEEGDFQVIQILLLPYFNSGSSDDMGFVFYPDGSGAISDYSKDYNNAADITQTVYGFDRGIGTVEVVSQAYGYRMPVYGAKTNNASYLAVIKGEASFAASVHTGVMRRNNRYFKNGVIFTYRDVGKVNLRHNETTVNTSYVIPAPVTLAHDMVSDYLLLEGDINITAMASAYRAYLERSGVFTDRLDASSDIHITFINSLVKTISFLGIPMDSEVTLTTFKQAGAILDELKKINAGRVSARFTGAQKSGYQGQWTRDYSFSASSGGRNEWNKLVQNYMDNVLFINGEVLQIYRGGRGYSDSNYAARTTGNGLNFQYDYFLQDGTRSGYGRRWTLISPAIWADTLSRFGSSVLVLSKNISLEDAGMLVYSEYNQNYPAYRDQTGPVLVESLKSLASRSERFALTGGNAYTWGIADTLYSVPLGASNYYIQSDEVPFYQIAVHGYIEYSGEPMNQSADKQIRFLRSLEYGALTHYYGIYAPSSSLNRTVLSGMFSSCYKDWIDDAAAQAKQYKDFYQRTAGTVIASHEKLSEGIFRTTFDNGFSVTVDYNTRSFTTEG